MWLTPLRGMQIIQSRATHAGLKRQRHRRHDIIRYAVAESSPWRRPGLPGDKLRRGESMGRADRGPRVQLAGSASGPAVRGGNAPLEADSSHVPAADAPAGQVPAGAVPARDAPAGDVPAGGRPWGRGRAAPLARHLILLACYVAAGIAVTWPRVTYLGGRLPDTRDAGGYVWI